MGLDRFYGIRGTNIRRRYGDKIFGDKGSPLQVTRNLWGFTDNRGMQCAAFHLDDKN